MLFNLGFANNTILLCFFFFLLVIDLCFLIPAVIAHVLNPIEEVVICIGIPIKEAKEEIEIYPVTVEAKTRKFQYNLGLYNPFCAFCSSINLALFL